jgi:ribosome-binding factor A
MKKINNPRDKEVTRGRSESVIRKIIDEYISKNSGGQSLITITSMIQADRSNDLYVGISVLPENKEAAVIDFLNRNVTDIRDDIKKKSRVGMLPFLHFSIDKGEKHRQAIFDLI